MRSCGQWRGCRRCKWNGESLSSLVLERGLTVTAAGQHPKLVVGRPVPLAVTSLLAPAMPRRLRQLAVLTNLTR